MCDSILALKKIILEKRTNICFAGDFDTLEEVINVVDEIGPYICLLKTHVDIYTDFSFEKINKLKSLSKHHNFLIWEDRKFADISKIVIKQLTSGIYKIATWADFVTAHSILGMHTIKELGGICEINGVGLILLAQMSSKDNLISSDYVRETVNMAKDIPSVQAIVTQERLNADLLHITPGVKMEKSIVKDQQYRTPTEIDTDIFVIGASNNKNKVKMYQEMCFRSD
jgi:orotidine 5'-phosphate decarboxylase subfamily 1